MESSLIKQEYSFLKKLEIEEINSGASFGLGHWTPIEGRDLLEVRSPIDNTVIAKVAQANDDDYEIVVKAAVENFREWQMLPAPKRGDIVRQFANEIRELKEPLGKLITLEMGKIVQEGMGEVQEVIDIADFAVGLSRQLYGLTMKSERSMHRMFEQWHPLGAIGIITAFNFPMAVWSWNAMIAAVAGDTMIWKPSSKVPLCAIAIQKIANKVMAKNGVEGIFNICIGKGSSIGEKLIHDDRIPLISFTGSTRMGRRVAEVTARRFARSILELGGNNAIVVMDDANLELTERAIIFGAIGTAGQRCTTTRRIIAHEKIIGELTERLIKAYKQITIGNPLEDGILMGPLVDKLAVEDMQEALEELPGQGGKIVYGGKKLDQVGNYVTPALVQVNDNVQRVCHETFAPILYLIPFKDLDHAIQLHNGVPQGLSSAIFTDSLKSAERFLSAIGSDCGIANVNIGTSGAEIGGAFGGTKETGGGREAGSDAWKGYMRRQTNTINWSDKLPLAQGIKFG
ncbi:MAG: aldehyde dehydrogenase family protein [Candidatus Heimdallarchaeota archaeon]